MRRFTRLTNAHSKKLENLTCAVALHFAYYNFCRVHSTLKTTPAVAAGVTDHVWTLKELIALLETVEDAQPRERGPYKKRQKPLHSKLTQCQTRLHGTICEFLNLLYTY
jgi:hypothetical protein